jgi:hypothetical protein
VICHWLKRLQYGHQGWVRVDGVEGAVVLAKTIESEGRRIIVDLVLSGNPWAPGINSTVLRGLPIGWIESMINTPEARRVLTEQDAGNDLTYTALERRSRAEFIEGDQLPYAIAAETPRLARPDGSDPEAFYRQVADAYNAAVARSSKVAPLLAEEAGVPIPTVHRWIAEARRRGFLPPARRGKAG